eukprot:CAMPEP_0176403230 /NCGR_PEP_ID=MMETSP0126-20121128/49927_1 /TAXON_ID=141414 ORGANISM="Strombidinopsis acuminatum, Strain SPMC142" /NCGR_SAMPLE_ID=MMETSP0126 /ASSEMBLY_ACC=CAM_ASM_000229 /LENGTH=80 /DNA_ID=CAMNT_0017781353 /DNA_START=627 /DNA_END=869 /DNA_ORIENTATION=-
MPPLMLMGIERVGMMPRASGPRTAVEVACIAFELYLCVPLGTGIFPREGQLSADELEEEFRNKVDAKGNKIKEFYFNKGL